MLLCVCTQARRNIVEDWTSIHGHEQAFEKWAFKCVTFGPTIKFQSWVVLSTYLKAHWVRLKPSCQNYPNYRFKLEFHQFFFSLFKCPFILFFFHFKVDESSSCILCVMKNLRVVTKNMLCYSLFSIIEWKIGTMTVTTRFCKSLKIMITKNKASQCSGGTRILVRFGSKWRIYKFRVTETKNQ